MSSKAAGRFATRVPPPVPSPKRSWSRSRRSRSRSWPRLCGRQPERWRSVPLVHAGW